MTFSFLEILSFERYLRFCIMQIMEKTKYVHFFFLYFFIFPLNKYEYNIFNKISTVKKKWKGHKYSNLIICPLIEYISFRIKRKLERKE